MKTSFLKDTFRKIF